MQEFERHIDVMFHLLHDYCKQEGILSEISALVIVRRIERETGKPLALAVVGEPASVALVTCQDAIEVLTQNVIHEHASQQRKVPTA